MNTPKTKNIVLKDQLKANTFNDLYNYYKPVV